MYAGEINAKSQSIGCKFTTVATAMLLDAPFGREFRISDIMLCVTPVWTLEMQYVYFWHLTFPLDFLF